MLVHQIRSQEMFYFWFEHKISHAIIYVYSFSHTPITTNDWNTLSSVKTHPGQYILLVVTNNDNQNTNACYNGGSPFVK